MLLLFKMVIAIEGIYKEGVIKPLEDIKIEDNSKVVITILDTEKTKKPKKSLAGIWKYYRTYDGKTLDHLKKEIYEARKISTRPEVKID